MAVLGCTAGLFRLKVLCPNESVASHALVTLHAYAGGRGQGAGCREAICCEQVEDLTRWGCLGGLMRSDVLLFEV